MKRYVLDTSAAIPWYLPESFSAGARQWQRKMIDQEIEIFVPDLHFQEFANVLRSYVKRKELEPRLAHEIYQLHLEAPLKLSTVDTKVLLKTALNYDATVYDSVYIQLSLSLNSKLLTAEKTTTPWVKKMGDLVINISNP